jgi:hypothetical protein
LRGLARNALAIVSEKDSPSLFITLTCNPQWPELLEMLPQGQCAYDRPDITNRVFKHRLQAFMQNLRNGKYFDDFHDNGTVKVRREIMYEIQVIEYQNRGLPHCHLVVKLTNTPTFKDNPDLCASWVDSHIQAEVMKHPITEEDFKLLELQEKHMTHSCRRGQSGCLNEEGKCSKHFDTNLVLQHSTFQEKSGRVNYRRRSIQDLNICQHERKSLLDWDGHCFIDYCGSAHSVLYLYKYLYKGAKKAKLRLTNAEDIDDDDEINLYIRGRYLCSMDCMWRCLGYRTYPRPTPAVFLIKVKMPAVLKNLQDLDKLSCDLLQYFYRPQDLYHMTYCEFNNSYIIYNKRTPYYLQTKVLNLDYYIIHIPRIKSSTLYYCKRSRTSETITRMEMVSPKAGELWYLRQILLKKPCYSFDDAKTHNGILIDTFQEASITQGFLETEKEANICFQEAMLDSTPSELRYLFVLLTIQGFPTLQIYYDEETFDLLVEDYR